MQNQVHDAIQRCEQLAYEQGIAAGLALALDGIDVSAPPGRVAALPSSRVARGVPVLPHRIAAQEGISFLRCDEQRATVTGQSVGFGARLAAARLGVTRRLLDWAIDHLAHRVAGDEPIIRKQLVQGTVADLQTEIESARRMVQVSWNVPSAMADLHERVSRHDWEAAKLLGASGYVAGSPTWGAYVSRLVANCWIPGDGAPCSN